MIKTGGYTNFQDYNIDIGDIWLFEKNSLLPE